MRLLGSNLLNPFSGHFPRKIKRSVRIESAQSFAMLFGVFVSSFFLVFKGGFTGVFGVLEGSW